MHDNDVTIALIFIVVIAVIVLPVFCVMCYICGCYAIISHQLDRELEEQEARVVAKKRKKRLRRKIRPAQIIDVEAQDEAGMEYDGTNDDEIRYARTIPTMQKQDYKRIRINPQHFLKDGVFSRTGTLQDEGMKIQQSVTESSYSEDNSRKIIPIISAAHNSHDSASITDKSKEELNNLHSRKSEYSRPEPENAPQTITTKRHNSLSELD